MYGRDDVKAEATVVPARRRSGGLRAAGWALGALVVAIALSFAANVLFVDVLDAAIDPLTGGAVVPEWIEVTGTALLVGGAIGGVVGSRVARGAVALSVGVTLLYLFTWPFAVFITRGWLLAVGAALHVAAAALAARWMRRRAAEG